MHLIGVIDVFRGGTRVTVYGRHFDSVAEPRITISVYVTSSSNNVTDIFTDSAVTHTHTHIARVTALG